MSSLRHYYRGVDNYDRVRNALQVVQQAGSHYATAAMYASNLIRRKQLPQGDGKMWSVEPKDEMRFSPVYPQRRTLVKTPLLASLNRHPEPPLSLTDSTVPNEEFLLLIPRCTVNNAGKAAERLRSWRRSATEGRKKRRFLHNMGQEAFLLVPVADMGSYKTCFERNFVISSD